MIVRRLASRRLVKRGSTEEEPIRRRAARFLLAILIAGLLSGVDAWLGLWPFGSVQTIIKTAFSNTQQLGAASVFPPVQPTHRTVDVYDPVPPAPRATSQPAPIPTRPASGTRTPPGSPPPDE